MSISGIGNIAATQAATASANPSTVSTAVGGGLPFGSGAGATGAVIAQPGIKSLVAKVLGGAVLGAGLGFGASFLSLPVIGVVAAPIAAAVGAGIGALGGLAWHLLSKRNASLALEAQQNALPSGNQPVPVQTAVPKGATLKRGSRGPATRLLQTQLKKLGLLAKVTGTYDGPTVAAVRRYEVMKGVMPTGLGSPDLRAAVAQDTQLIARYA